MVGYFSFEWFSLSKAVQFISNDSHQCLRIKLFKGRQQIVGIQSIWGKSTKLNTEAQNIQHKNKLLQNSNI